MEQMASSSSSQQKNQELRVLEPGGIRRKVCESSTLFDVFINHRGPDVKQTLATQLYNSLEQLGIRAFLDSQEKELGNSFPSTIETAIRSAKVHIAIFSERYAESPWCLDELLLMQESTAKIIPVFYQVKPSDLRHIEKGAYAKAFIKHGEKGRYHEEKLRAWKEALQSISLIAGEEFNSDWAHYQEIVDAARKEVERKRCLHVADHPVGLNEIVEDFERRSLDGLVEDIENKCGLKNRKDKGKVVGIFGMGGLGKTTLAKELSNRMKSNYIRSSFLFDVREADVRNHLPRLQRQLLKDLFNNDVNIRSIEEGKSHLKDHLQGSSLLNFLIVIDDIDHVKQLNALLVVDFFKRSSDCLVIVTTRDVGVLITAGISDRYCLKGMDGNYGRELFCWHAFGQGHPSSGYEKLVDGFVAVCGGLPLSLQVLGRHVRGRTEGFWSSELIKVREMLHRDVKHRLRISFESLDYQEKQVFMDVACFFVGKPTDVAERILGGSGWNAHNAIETLKDKCLLEKKEVFRWEGPVLRMHDHLRDLGREMAQEHSPPRRRWRPQDLKSLESMGFKTILAKTDIRCYHSIFDKSMDSQVTFFLGQANNDSEKSGSLLWLQLEGNSKEQPSIPSWVPLQNLQCLNIKGGRLKTLWKNRVQAPSQLKELQISETSLKGFADLLVLSKHSSESVKTAMSSLEKLEIRGEKFVSKILISGTHYPRLRSIQFDGMESLIDVSLTRVETLNRLDITNCKKLKRFTGTSDLTNLVLLNISQCPDLEFEDLRLSLRDMKCLQRITLDRNVKLKFFQLDGCQNLKTVDFGYEELVELSIRGCPELEQMPAFTGLSWLERIIIDGCGKFECLQLNRCQKLRSVSGNFAIRRLYISDCPKLEELPSLWSLSCMEQIEIYSCEKLKNIMLPTTLNSLSIQSCRDLQRVSGTSDLSKLTSLHINKCPKLQGLPTFSRSSSLQKFQVGYCEKLQNITLPTTLMILSVRSCRGLQRVVGSGDLTNLTKLYINECPELEGLPSLDRLSCLKKIEIYSCEKLQNITLPTTLINLFIHSCRDLLRVSGTGDFMELTWLIIKQCPVLEELPSLDRLSCLKQIEIQSCEKLQNITLPTTLVSLSIHSCRDLKRVSGTGDFMELTWMIIKQCPVLEELPSLARLSCLKQIEIHSCEKLHIEELNVPEYMELNYCNNAVIRKCIHKLKSMPSNSAVLTGRAGDGAESSLNEYLFRDANIGVDGVIDIGTDKTYPRWSELSFVIRCFLVVVDSSTSVQDINKNEGLNVREGEWIITMVASDYWRSGVFQKIEDDVRRCGIMKKGFLIEVKKGQERKSLGVLRTIVDRLYHF